MTGSFCRTPINSKAGAQTLLSGVLAGIIVIVAIEAAANSFRYIPQASLAAIVMVAVVPLADFRVRLAMMIIPRMPHMIQVPLQIWRVSPIDVLPYIVCFVTVLFGGVEYAVLSMRRHADPLCRVGMAAAVGLSMFIILVQISR